MNGEDEIRCYDTRKEPITPELEEIRNGFLSKTCINHLIIDDYINYIGDNQKEFLNVTVLHKLNRKYPLKRSYQLLFLKRIIHMLEFQNIEVVDEIYEEYLKLLNTENRASNHYSHISIDRDYITIKENDNVISNGTTGLAVWEAGRILAQYLTENKHITKHKRILELGSGLGLTGLAAIKHCQPTHYCFSDSHDEVLNYLSDNIRINLGDKLLCDTTKKTEFPMLLLDGMYDNSRVSILNLAWENSSEFNVDNIAIPDLILAADVVYDESIFLPLAKTLSKLLTENKAEAVIACTVRNCNTMESFFDCIHTLNLHEKFIETKNMWNYNRDGPSEIKIFSIHHIPLQ